jgi:dCTP deaminase
MRLHYADPENRRVAADRQRWTWADAPDDRRDRQREIARVIRLRPEITRDVARRALHETGSIRGAARALGCDRSVFRRFPGLVEAFRGTPRRLNHKVAAIRSLPGDHDVYCLTVPEAGNFALDAGVFVRNCGIVVNVTPLEPSWEGYLTLEISNTTPLPAKIYAGEGIAQLLFFEGDEEPEVAYSDRKGKYQRQTGVTLPKL